MATWPARKVLALAIGIVCPPALKPWLLGWCCQIDTGPGARIGWLAAVAAKRIRLGPRAAIQPFTIISLDGDLTMGADAEISSFNLVYGSSSLEIGDDAYVGPQSLINADEPVRLGTLSALGARSVVYTHGSFLPYTEGYVSRRAPVDVGSRVHCAAGVFLHPGTRIGEESFVSSRSVVSGEVAAGSVVRGNPAEVIGSMDGLRRKMSPARVDLALRRILDDYVETGLRRELDVEPASSNADGIVFEHRRRRYRIVPVPSDADRVSAPPDDGRLTVWVVNRRELVLPAAGVVFNVPAGVVTASRDPIVRSLRRFMLRYYGVRFKDS